MLAIVAQDMVIIVEDMMTEVGTEIGVREIISRKDKEKIEIENNMQEMVIIGVINTINIRKEDSRQIPILIGGEAQKILPVTDHARRTKEEPNPQVHPVHQAESFDREIILKMLH